MLNYEVVEIYFWASVTIACLLFSLLIHVENMDINEKIATSLSLLPVANMLIVILILLYIFKYLKRPDNINCFINRLLTIKKDIIITSNLFPEKAINEKVEIVVKRLTLIGVLKANYISETKLTAANCKWFWMTRFHLHEHHITHPTIYAQLTLFNHQYTVSYNDVDLEPFTPNDYGFGLTDNKLSVMFDCLDRRQAIKTNVINHHIATRKFKLYLNYFKTIDELNKLKLEQCYVLIDEFGTPLIVAVLALFYDPLNNGVYTIKFYCYDDKAFYYIPLNEIKEIYAFNNTYQYGKTITTDGEIDHAYTISYMTQT